MTQQFGFFNAKELASRDGAKSPFPTVVHPDLLHLLNILRRKFGKPILVNSAYRSPEHNRKVGGVENSYHVQGLAADIRPQKAEDLETLQDLALELVENGGVGLYDTFVHVDARGKYARWDERTK